MSKPAQEWLRLKGYFYAKKNAPRCHAVSKRFAKKSIGKATGQRGLKSFSVTSTCHIETVFPTRR